MDKLQKRLGVSNERYQTMVSIKEDYIDGRISLEEGRKLLKEKIGTCTPDEFAYGEQILKGKYNDEVVADKMDDLLELFAGILVRAENVYPVNHPLWVYMEEMNKMEAVLAEADTLLKAPNFIKNPWLGIYDSLNQWRVHLQRKQMQLYPMLEKYGFDRPTKIMWTFDDGVRDAISKGYRLLTEDKVDEFLAYEPEVQELVLDLINKEKEVLLATSYKLLSEAEFEEMSKSDHEIGFALITPPPVYKSSATDKAHPTDQDSNNGVGGNVGTQDGADSNDFMKDLANLLGKYNIAPTASGTIDPDQELDVATGKLSLNRINLLFKHLPVDLSYVDENELVKFYSDTDHRIFPRSANVIGREVKNCHPAKSVHIVEEIVRKFRSGEQSQAEFWINKPGLFIYVLYTAVRDEKGNFKGVLEMMQDCTHIRALEGSRTLLTWDGNYSKEATANDDSKPAYTEKDNVEASSEKPETPEQLDGDGQLVINGKTIIGQIMKRYPDVVDHLATLNPKLEKLKGPMGKIMSKVATLDMIGERSGLGTEKLVESLKEFIANHK